MCLYGQDLDEQHSPFSANLRWAVDLKDPSRDFIGRVALQNNVELKREKLVGLVLEKGGVLRRGMQVLDAENVEQVVGEITSGGFSPSLKKSVAFARVSLDAPEQFAVEMRGRSKAVRRTKPIFYKRGKALV